MNEARFHRCAGWDKFITCRQDGNAWPTNDSHFRKTERSQNSGFAGGQQFATAQNNFSLTDVRSGERNVTSGCRRTADNKSFLLNVGILDHDDGVGTTR